MLKFRNLPAAMLLALLCVAGCGDDAVSPPPDAGEGSAVIAAGGMSFAMDMACADSAGYLDGGPYRLRGTNLRYDHDVGALAVDLSVYNAGDLAVPEPVRLVLTAVMPDSALVIGADNGVTGPGAEFVCEFANDDGMWTGGEVSFPRTVMFDVDPGVAVAFAGEIRVGSGEFGGAIVGTVWNDLNGDGVRTRNELGLSGVTVSLTIDGIQGAPIPLVVYATTGPVGDFRFASLPAGYYDVTVLPPVGTYPTTPAVIHVLLADAGTGVSDFIGADFGLGGVEIPGIIAPVEADATIRRDLMVRANDNYGLDPHLDVGGVRETPFGLADGCAGIVSLMTFAMPEIAAPISNAWLELTLLDYVEGCDRSYRLQVHRIVDSGYRTPWIEGNGCEAQPPTPGSVDVNTAHGVAWVGSGDGGDWNNVTRPDIAAEPAGILEFDQGSVPRGTTIRIQVTDLVRGWMSGDYPNFGLALLDGLGDCQEFKQIRFASREFGSIDPAGLLRLLTPRIVLDVHEVVD